MGALLVLVEDELGRNKTLRYESKSLWEGPFHGKVKRYTHKGALFEQDGKVSPLLPQRQWIPRKGLALDESSLAGMTSDGSRDYYVARWFLKLLWGDKLKAMLEASNSVQEPEKPFVRKRYLRPEGSVARPKQVSSGPKFQGFNPAPELAKRPSIWSGEYLGTLSVFVSEASTISANPSLAVCPNCGRDFGGIKGIYKNAFNKELDSEHEVLSWHFRCEYCGSVLVALND